MKIMIRKAMYTVWPLTIVHSQPINKKRQKSALLLFITWRRIRHSGYGGGDYENFGDGDGDGDEDFVDDVLGDGERVFLTFQFSSMEFQIKFYGFQINS